MADVQRAVKQQIAGDIDQIVLCAAGHEGLSQFKRGGGFATQLQATVDLQRPRAVVACAKGGGVIHHDVAAEGAGTAQGCNAVHGGHARRGRLIAIDQQCAVVDGGLPFIAVGAG